MSEMNEQGKTSCLEKEFNCGICDKAAVCKHVLQSKDLIDYVEVLIDNNYIPDCIHFSVYCDYYKQYFVTR